MTEYEHITIMCQESHWMSSLPAGEGVGAEPGVDNAEVGHQAGLDQVQVVLPQLTRVKLSLVHNGLGGQRADVEPYSWTGDGVCCKLKILRQLIYLNTTLIISFVLY